MYWLIILIINTLVCQGLEGNKEAPWFKESMQILKENTLRNRLSPYYYKRQMFVENETGAKLAIVRGYSRVKYAEKYNDRKNEYSEKNIFCTSLFSRVADFLGFGDFVVPNVIVDVKQEWYRLGKPEAEKCLFEKYLPLEQQGTEYNENVKKAIKSLKPHGTYSFSKTLVELYEERNPYSEAEKTNIINALDEFSMQAITILYMLLKPSDCTHRNILIHAEKDKLLSILTDTGESFGFTHPEGPFKPTFLALGHFAENPFPQRIIELLDQHSTSDLKEFITKLKSNYPLKWRLTDEQENQLYARHRNLVDNKKLLASVSIAEFMFVYMHDKDDFIKVFESGNITPSCSGFNFDGFNSIPSASKSTTFWKEQYIKSVPNSNAPSERQTIHIKHAQV